MAWLENPCKVILDSQSIFGWDYNLLTRKFKHLHSRPSIRLFNISYKGSTMVIGEPCKLRGKQELAFMHKSKSRMLRIIYYIIYFELHLAPSILLYIVKRWTDQKSVTIPFLTTPCRYTLLRQLGRFNVPYVLGILVDCSVTAELVWTCCVQDRHFCPSLTQHTSNRY